MASNFIGKKTATLTAIALIAVAATGSAFYFLNSASISASTFDPGMPSIPGEPISQPSKTSTAAATGTATSSQNIVMPPVPNAPTNDLGYSSSTSNSSINSGSSSAGANSSSVSAYGIDNSSLTSATVDDGSTYLSGEGSALSSSSVIATPVNPQSSFNSQELTTANMTTDASDSNKLYGIIAGTIAGIALIALVILAMKWRSPSDQVPLA